MPFRHSKIVCTIGPASCLPRVIERLFRAGMDVARLNFSHGTQQDHAQTIQLLRATAEYWAARRKPFFAVFVDPAKKLTLPDLYREA